LRRSLFILGAALAGILALVGCTSDTRSDQEKAKDTAAHRQNYIPVNDVEGRNYNARQRIADQPSTLIWCTAYPTSPNAKAFTVPIVGKLTSGNKRPFPTMQDPGNDTNAGWFNPELPGPDGFYGTSGEYRYGFDPAGNYHDFYNLETYCTTLPNIVQKEQTTIIVGTNADLSLVDKQVEAALVDCRKKDPDPSHACPAAARILAGS
jgi:hypothetical protein